MIKKINLKKIIDNKLVLLLLSFFVLLFISTLITYAAAPTYQPLATSSPFAGFDTATPTGSPLADFLGQVFNFGIAAAVVLALIMIIWGGIMYMTTDSWETKEDGKKKIQDALWGLGLALTSYLILYTINPCLVVWTSDQNCTSNTLLFSSATSVGTSNNTSNDTPNTGGSESVGGLLSNDVAVQKLEDAGIYIKSTGGCDDPNKSNCTNFEGIPESTINNIIEVNASCGGCINATGGTETGHTYHTPGEPIVDISYNQPAVDGLKTNGLAPAMDYANYNTYICERFNKPIACGECDAYINTNTQCHIHVQFNK
jgi:hypothetical protein